MADKDNRYYEDEREDERAGQSYEPADEPVYEEEENTTDAPEQDEEPVQEEAYDDEADDQHPKTQLESLLNYLVDEISSAKPIPFNNTRRSVNARMIMDVVDDIRACLPDEIRHAMDIMADRDQIIAEARSRANTRLQAADARADAIVASAQKQAEELERNAKKRADDMIASAEERARHMIDQSEIVRLAHEEADKMCEEARAEANEQRLSANRYAENILREMERDVQATLDAVRHSIENVSKQG
jgi:vacuolar-type H+-ATPase subunit H